MSAQFPGPWWCSVCGSERIESSSIQASLGDPKHPLGLCWECRGPAPKPDAVGYSASGDNGRGEPVAARVEIWDARDLIDRLRTDGIEVRDTTRETA